MSSLCTSEADSKFLMAVIATGKISLDWDAIAEYMGEGVTANALRCRFSRMKTKAQAFTNLPQGSANTPKSTPQSTPKRTSKETPKSTPGKRKRAKLSQDPKIEVEVEIKTKKEETEIIKKEEPVEDIKMYDDHLSDC